MFNRAIDDRWRLGRVAATCAAAIVLAGCAAPGGGGGAKSGATSAKPVVPEKVAEIAATLPGGVRDAGTLRVGINLPYPPNEFEDDKGKLVGFDVELMEAITTTLGLTPEYREFDFPKIIPSVADETVDVAISSITDTKKREQLVDFVTYFSAGVQWAQRPGSDIDPKNACGKRIAVKAQTIQATDELVGKNKACVDAGKRKIEIFEYIDQEAVNEAVIVGKVDAMTADSPVTAYAIKESGGKLEAAGALFDAAPYGIAVKKDSVLGQSLLQAVQHLVKTGAYKQIATKWGLAAGMIEKPVINGAAG